MNQRGFVTFFDIGDTLAAAVLDSGHLARLDVFPFVPDVLVRVRAAGGEGTSVGVGLLSNTGNETAARLHEVLADAQLLPLLDEELCLFSSVEGFDKSQPEFFELARQRAGAPASHCLYVGEDADERAVAAGVGFRVSPQPLHALHLVEGAITVP